MLGCARRFGAHRGRRGAGAYHGGRLDTVVLSASRSVDCVSDRKPACFIGLVCRTTSLLSAGLFVLESGLESIFAGLVIGLRSFGSKSFQETTS